MSRSRGLPPWAWMLGAALAVFYATRPALGESIASNLAALAGVATLLWRWDRAYSKANPPQ